MRVSDSSGLADRDRGHITVRRAEESDEAAVLDLLRLSLGWGEGDPNLELFRWKHHENPVGRSPGWVAEARGSIIGFRTFLLWRFAAPNGDVTAVRAVDTATHPDYQGRGIFSRLTMHALDQLATEGVAFVFNTPNDKSRPGYLKMGWRPVGRLPISTLTAGATAVGRVLRARTAAERWSMPTSAGEPALAVIGADLFDQAAPGAGGTTTARTPDYLRWRYGFAPLHYRAVRAGDGSVAIFRLRRRGAATEAAICELSAPDRAARRRLVRSVLSASGADYAVTLGSVRVGLALPRQGPLLVQRPLAAAAPSRTSEWRLSLGDIELF